MSGEPLTDLTHVTPTGDVHIVDVGEKHETERIAQAVATIHTTAQTTTAVRTAATKKGDVLAVGRVAGIMAAKRTSELIPLCHAIPLTSVEVDIQVLDTSFEVCATAKTVGRTGVEMEALVAATVTSLTIYDMCKALDRAMTISEVKLRSKSGGKSGDWTRSTAD
jgi:cyclic pyranopterin phosphate synthase